MPPIFFPPIRRRLDGLDYLIAGGNGFIGSNFIAYMLRKDPSATIMNLDRYRKESIEELMGINEFQGRYLFKEGDICELSTYEHYVKVADVVVNCFSESDRTRFDERMERFVRTNVLGARILADAACRSDVPMLHISTDEVYGSCPISVQRRDETCPLDPSNPYSTTMAAGERLVTLAARKAEVPAAILRPCELIGPNPRKEGLVPLNIRRVLEGQPPIYWGKVEERYRDFLHVLDLCSAMELVIRSLTGARGGRSRDGTQPEIVQPGKTVISGTNIATLPVVQQAKVQPLQMTGGVTTFNVTGELRYSLTNIMERMLSIMGSNLPMQESSDDNYRDVGYNPSGRKLSYHGWQAKYTDIDEVLRSTIEWYKEHPETLESSMSRRLLP